MEEIQTLASDTSIVDDKLRLIIRGSLLNPFVIKGNVLTLMLKKDNQWQKVRGFALYFRVNNYSYPSGTVITLEVIKLGKIKNKKPNKKRNENWIEVSE